MQQFKFLSRSLKPGHIRPPGKFEQIQRQLTLLFLLAVGIIYLPPLLEQQIEHAAFLPPKETQLSPGSHSSAMIPETKCTQILAFSVVGDDIDMM